MLLKKSKDLYLRAFLYGLGIAFVMFLPYLIFDQGYFLFFGDFNVQQVPFYKMCHDAVRSGNIFWNWNTDLGANFIGSYSFYLLGSPFFWLTIPFPSAAVPYLMGPLLILKFACASLTGYIFLRRFVKNQHNAVLGGLLYAFSGFSVYNIFFNHFHEAIVIFPLLLLGIELYMTENRKGVFAAAVFLAAFSNYFFFAGMVVFAVLYWIIRMLSGAWKITAPRFMWMAFEAAVGVLIAAVLLFPTYLAVIQNPRTGYMLMGWDAVLYSRPQVFLNIIQTLFFPPDLPARAVFFPDAQVQWSSLAAWLPLFSTVGTIAFLKAKKGHWLRRIILITWLMALVPILNSAFYMFNEAYYARWYYMPILMMVLATVMALEDREIDWQAGFKWTAGITAVFIAVIGLFPSEKDENGNITRWGLYTADTDGTPTYITRFWITCGIAVISLIVLYFLLPTLRKNAKKFARQATVAVAVISILYGGYFLGLGKAHSFDTRDFIIPNLLQNADSVDLENSDNVRTDVYEGMDNTGMFLGLPTIQAFHSIVPQSIMDFYPYVGVERGVGSRPEPSHYGLRSLLSVRWLLDYTGDSKNFYEDGNTKIPGYTYYDTQNDFAVYENDNYIPYGFTYDYYISREDADAYDAYNRELLMLKAIVLDNDQAARHGDILEDFSETNQSAADFTYDNFVEDCAARRAVSCHTFSRDNTGYSAQIDLEKEDLVFFSVPYEGGWTATVDGQPVEIEQVNIGFMAVRVPAGSHDIRFNYMTPGLQTGGLVTLGGILLFALYLLGWKLYRRNHTEAFDRAPGQVPAPFSEIPGQMDLDALMKETPSEEFFGREKQEEAGSVLTRELEDIPPMPDFSVPPDDSKTPEKAEDTDRPNPQGEESPREDHNDGG